MLTVCWSPKGGSGTSVVAAALALQTAAAGDECLLIDLDGDQPAILGLAPCGEHGATDWLASPDVPVDALRALEVPVVERLRLLPRGSAHGSEPDAARMDLMAGLLETSTRSVVLDAGSGRTVERWWPASASTVTISRTCYLALRRLTGGASAVGDRVVLVEEAGRALTRRDAAGVLGEIAVHLPWDPAVARAVDAGLLAHRMPRSLRPLRVLASVGPRGRTK